MKTCDGCGKQRRDVQGDGEIGLCFCCRKEAERRSVFWEYPRISDAELAALQAEALVDEKSNDDFWKGEL